MEPLMGSLLGVFVLGEHLGPSAWTGGCMILAAAIILTTRSKAHVLEVQPAG
jgi:drug/metabolite transporter (DMT)-like permease